MNETVFEKKKVFEHKTCVLNSPTNSVYKISHSKRKWDRYQKCISVIMWSNCSFCHILMKLDFSFRFFENTQNSNLINICLMGAELFHADRRTWWKLIITFHLRTRITREKQTSMPRRERPQTSPENSRPPGSGIKSHYESNDKDWTR